MARRTRKAPVKRPANPQDVLHVPEVSGKLIVADPDVVAAAEGLPPSPKVEPAAPASPKQAVFVSGLVSAPEAHSALAPAPPANPAREKTLHELNLEARQIDRYHAIKRAEAQAKFKEVVEPMLAAVPKVASRTVKRTRKPLTAPMPKK